MVKCQLPGWAPSLLLEHSVLLLSELLRVLVDDDAGICCRERYVSTGRHSTETKKRTDLNEPDDDQDGNKCAFDGDLRLPAGRLLVGILGLLGDTSLHVRRGVSEQSVETEGTGDDGEDEVGGQHRPEDGD